MSREDGMRPCALAVRIEMLDWARAAPLVTPLRLSVFVDEQGVPADLELDEFDAVSLHAVAIDDGGAVRATGRLLPDGHIGRMAVDAGWRRQGLGGAVLEALAGEAARRNIDEVRLNAQLGALDFYRKHGFTAFGEVFDDAGIAHRAMRRCSRGQEGGGQ